MKFSWQLTSNFLNIQKESFHNILEKLILSGIEVENIEHINKDILLDLSITNNRKEINSTLSLAREINAITEKLFKIQPINLNIDKKIINNNYGSLSYRRVHTINNYKNIATPKWILESLKIHGKDRDSENYLENIQKYIKLKWGKTFRIITSNIQEESTFTEKKTNNNKLISSIIYQNIKNIKNQKFKLLIFDVNKTFNINRYEDYDDNNFYENYYIDSINIIKEINQNPIGKYHESYDNISLQHKELILEKKTLNRWLGSYKSDKDKFLPTENIKKTLDNLKFFNRYVKKKKLFVVSIPPYREHDIRNKIDLIEEIGKINEFKNFHNQYPYNREKGKSSNRLITINKMRSVLRTLGFNEVINCSITDNKLQTKGQILMHNPISEEQKHLRNNILSNLIENHKNHVKYSNNNLLISEIGKIFKPTSSQKGYYEEQRLGGLIYGPKYNKINWSNKPEQITLFQAKGIIEIFLKQINADIHLSSIEKDYKNHNITNLLKTGNRIGIYNHNTKELIGLIGEINTQARESINIKNQTIYGFEIQATKLIETTKDTKHLEYSKKLYSNYPSIVRDISIPISKNRNIESLKQQIHSMNTELVESIEIFNEYNKNINTKFVGVRITYRSFNKTLDINDINKIDKNLLQIRNMFVPK